MSWLAKLPWDPQSCWSGRHVINTIRAWSLALKRDSALISFPWARLSLFFHFLLAPGVIISPRSESISPLPSETWHLTHFTSSKVYLLRQTNKIFAVIQISYHRWFEVIWHQNGKMHAWVGGKKHTFPLSCIWPFRAYITYQQEILLLLVLVYKIKSTQSIQLTYDPIYKIEKTLQKLYKTCNPNHETRLPHKSKPKKVTKQNSQSSKKIK